jgi:hypothetical protein
LTTLAYSHTLVAGTPENINDVQDMFNDVKTWANGNVDATNLAATADPATLMGAYRIVAQGDLLFDSTTTAGTYYPANEGGSISPAPKIGVSITGTPVVIPINLPDFAVSGLTTQFRVQASTLTNPTASAINFTYVLQQVLTVGGGAGTLSIATTRPTPVITKVTRAAPAASSIFTDTTADFSLSASGIYVLVVQVSGTPAANSRVAVNLTLQAHYI